LNNDDNNLKDKNNIENQKMLVEFFKNNMLWLKQQLDAADLLKEIIHSDDINLLKACKEACDIKLELLSKEDGNNGGEVSG
jgi:hypothetical protein